MTDYTKIEQQIERLEAKSSVFVAKDCHEAAQSLRLLLDVAKAADAHMRFGPIDPLLDALAALKEAQ